MQHAILRSLNDFVQLLRSVERQMQRVQVNTGLRITKIQNQRTGAKDTGREWIRIANEGAQRWDLRGWLITDETDRQINPHIFKLPSVLADGSSWTLDPSEAPSLPIVGETRETDLLVTRVEKELSP